MSDRDSMSSTGGELDTADYKPKNKLNEKSPGKMSNKSPDKKGQPAKSFKGVSCNVVLLDGESIQISLDKNDTGKALFEQVCTHLNLIEKDYFGLTYTDSDDGSSQLKYWLNLDKKISKQKKRGAWVFSFALKFYPPDPTHLKESLTRWLVVLQVRHDLWSGSLPCTFTTYALLGSYNVQADVQEGKDNVYEYIKNMTFAPNQNPELLEKIAELHKQHRGQTPDEAERCFLDNAKKLSMYGVDLHSAKDSDGNDIMLGVCASGLLIYRDKLRINRFVWPKILKLSYKRNHFYIQIRPGETERSGLTIMFKLANHRLAKRLWKTCVEHHAFFRLRESEKPQHNPTFPRFGSKFRYSGRTLYQTRQTAALLDRPPPVFDRPHPNRESYADSSNRSKSVDELAGRNNKDPYGDSRYDPNGPDYDPIDPNRYIDGKDRRDLKDAPPAYGTYDKDGDYRADGEGGTLQRRPYDSNTEDRRDRLAGQDATLERGQGQGDNSMDIMAGGLTSQTKPETDKERRKREKEEEKKRKKEEDERKKREEEERKRAEEERKKAEEERKKAEKEAKKKKGKGGDLDVSEDRIDRLGGPGGATETTFGVDPGAAGLDNGPTQFRRPDGTYEDGQGPEGTDDPAQKYYTSSYTHPLVGKGADKDSEKDKDGKDKEKNKDKKRSSFFGKKKKDKNGDVDSAAAATTKDGHGVVIDSAAAGAATAGLGDNKGNWLGSGPYGVGLGVGKGDLTGVVGQEGSVDNKQFFEPVPEPVKGTKAALKGGQDSAMPFFHPAATSTVGRSKIPPPVPPKGNHSMDDSFNRNDYKTEKGGVEEIRVEKKVVMSGDEEDEFDFDAALSDAIRSVTEFNPDMSVERIECVQQIEDVGK